VSPRSLLSIATGAGLGVFSALFLQMEPAEQAEAHTPPQAAPAPKTAVSPPEAKQKREATVVSVAERAPEKTEAKGTAPATAAEVTRAEMACDARDKAGCLRAAEAYESGVVVPKNLSLARSYRKRELTLVVRSCDARSPAGCLLLSERYARGDGVERSEKTAEALVAHAREICSLRRSSECDALLASR
jgi:TPR repeat protein